MQVNLDKLPSILKPSIAAKHFPLSARRIQQLAREGRLPGARNFFGYWQIVTASLWEYVNSPKRKGGRPKRT